MTCFTLLLLLFVFSILSAKELHQNEQGIWNNWERIQDLEYLEPVFEGRAGRFQFDDVTQSPKERNTQP